MEKKRKYRVLLVDDEPMAREGLELSVDWNKIGFEVIGSAENGQQAIEMIAEQQPELVITDLSMPVMDGIELITYVRRHMHYQPKFLILTAYGTFDYAKSAMQLGVDTYILKPVIQSELERTLVKVKAGMDQDNEEKVAQDVMNKKLMALSQSYLTRILNGTVGEDKIHKLELIWNLNGSVKHGLVMKMRNTEDDIRALIEQAAEHLSLSPEPYEITLLTPTFAVCILEQSEIELGKRFSEELSRQTEGSHVVIELGPVTNWSDIRSAWELVSLALDACFYEREQSVFFTQKDKSLLQKKLEGYRQEALEEDTFKNADQIKTYFDALRKRKIHPEQVRINLLARLREAGIEDGERYKQQIAWMLSGELEDVWIQLVGEGEKNFEPDDIKHQIENYIKNYFQKNITIQDMAFHLCYNEVYLGRLVKKYEGMSFRRYLNKIRLEYAEQRLKSSQDSVIEIAYQSGFSNPDYFCKKFKEKHQMTPTDYRKR